VRVLRRQIKRARWQLGDRLLLAALSRCVPRTDWGRFPVRPETLLRWHRDLVRRTWAAFGRRRGPGRRPLARELREVTLRLARENPIRGSVRLRGERLKLGHPVAASPIQRLLRRHLWGCRSRGGRLKRVGSIPPDDARLPAPPHITVP